MSVCSIFLKLSGRVMVRCVTTVGLLMPQGITTAGQIWLGLLRVRVGVTRVMVSWGYPFLKVDIIIFFTIFLLDDNKKK